MSFGSGEFLIFLALSLAFCSLARSARGRQYVLLCASIVYYASWGLRYLPILVVSLGTAVALVPILASSAPRWTRRRLLIGGIVVEVGVLVVFKYLGFLGAAVNAAAGLLGFGRDVAPVVDLLLPPGISFFTFQTISYLVDAYEGQVTFGRDAALGDGVPAAGVTPALWTSLLFFPRVLSGPLTRARAYLPQFSALTAPSAETVKRAIALTTAGVLKKQVADLLLPIIDRFFDSPQAHSTFDAWTALLAYAANLYADFAGYSDMAIGIALLFGVELPRNFRLPYLANSPIDFWTRWHISLSTWLRDYVYLPIATSQLPGAALAGVIVTFLIGGLWHGARFTCLAWGLYQGLLVVATYLAGAMTSKRQWLPVRASALLRIGVTFYLVLIGFVLFRSPTMSVAFRTIGELHAIHSTPSAVSSAALVRLALVIGSLIFGHALDFMLYERPSLATRSPILVPLGIAATAFTVLAPALPRTFAYAAF